MSFLWICLLFFLLLVIMFFCFLFSVIYPSFICIFSTVILFVRRFVCDADCSPVENSRRRMKKKEGKNEIEDSKRERKGEKGGSYEETKRVGSEGVPAIHKTISNHYVDKESNKTVRMRGIVSRRLLCLNESSHKIPSPASGRLGDS